MLNTQCMKGIVTILTFLVCCELGSTACKKNEVQNNSDSSIIYLRNKSLAEIKSTINGRWKAHYMYGGMTGRVRYELEDSYFMFLPNDSIYITLSNEANTADKAAFERKETIYNYTAWFCKFTLLNGYKNELIIDMKVKDTLVLVQNVTDPFAYFMTKVE